jgi:hypothetical protein
MRQVLANGTRATRAGTQPGDAVGMALTLKSDEKSDPQALTKK